MSASASIVLWGGLCLLGFVGVICFSILQLRVPASKKKQDQDEVRYPGPAGRQLRAAIAPLHPALFHGFALVLCAFLALIVSEISVRIPWLGTAFFFISLYFCYALVLEIGRRRTARFEERLVDGIDIMIATLRGADNPRQALASASGVVPPPVGTEFREILRRLDLGMDIRRALIRLRMNYDSEGVRMFSSALVATWQTGGDLAPTLMNVNHLIRERIKHRLRVKSRLAGAQSSAILVAICPYVALLAMMIWNPVWIRMLFSHPWGPTLIFFAVICQLFGFLWLRRMMRVEL